MEYLKDTEGVIKSLAYFDAADKENYAYIGSSKSH